MDNTRFGVGPFTVGDLSYSEVVGATAELAAGDRGSPARAYALHVGGLNHRQDADFVEEMRAAELVYADGGSIVLLAKLAGARRVQRTPTTDIGWDVLRAVGQRLGRPARLALIGGPPGLANRAGAVLEDGAAGMVVFESDGFQDDWEPVLDRLVAAHADVCLVGMGAPREMLWVRTWYHRLPHTLVLTCGGWFGFLAGDERRAGALLRRSGLEWIARVAQSPRRLGGRYARGAISTGVVAAQTLGDRWRR
jgi:N-acetylglucosaminyldiphosphoundecaprenol N-acetyl-beta-D-mannosaminyltransferase